MEVQESSVQTTTHWFDDPEALESFRSRLQVITEVVKPPTPQTCVLCQLPIGEDQLVFPYEHQNAKGDVVTSPTHESCGKPTPHRPMPGALPR